MKPPHFLHLFGIRHHGPGSARALLAALQKLEPDAILVEGPPDANDIIHWLSHRDMEPPIALMVYRPDMPDKSSSYPFTLFSPEFQALRYGVQAGVVTRFFDLPQSQMMASSHRPKMPDTAVFQQIAQASGHSDYELWWNSLIEQRQAHGGLFEGVLELMQAMRSAAEQHSKADPSEEDTAAQKVADQREAHMRRAIRQAHAEGCQRIAVVCGAWHTPALLNLENSAADDALLADLSSVAIETAWVPWTYGRISATTGYGAGIRAPGWYHHLWQMGQQQTSPTQLSIAWLSHVAHLLREQDLDASSAHIIEAVRLAEALAAMRGLPHPGLPELNEATQARDLPSLTKLLDQALLAELPELVLSLMRRIEAQTAVSSDVPHMMDALLPLARVLRYGDVRQTDQTIVRQVVDTLVTRICIGLPSSCANLDDDAAAEMVERITAVHTVIGTQQNDDHLLAAWHETLQKLADQRAIHGLLAGKSTRLLLDTAVFSPEEASTRLERVLSKAAVDRIDPIQLNQMAAWVEGFLKGSGCSCCMIKPCGNCSTVGSSSLRPNSSKPFCPCCAAPSPPFPRPPASSSVSKLPTGSRVHKLSLPPIQPLMKHRPMSAAVVGGSFWDKRRMMRTTQQQKRVTARLVRESKAACQSKIRRWTKR